ncbi:MAG: tetratricopeptide repeat protein [Blastocatellia bacterium]
MDDNDKDLSDFDDDYGSPYHYDFSFQKFNQLSADKPPYDYLIETFCKRKPVVDELIDILRTKMKAYGIPSSKNPLTKDFDQLIWIDFLDLEQDYKQTDKKWQHYFEISPSTALFRLKHIISLINSNHMRESDFRKLSALQQSEYLIDKTVENLCFEWVKDIPNQKNAHNLQNYKMLNEVANLKKDLETVYNKIHEEMVLANHQLQPNLLEPKSASINTKLFLPYTRNPFFTGREDILSQLHLSLNPIDRGAFIQPQAIVGLGGTGKSQIALEYCYRYENNYRAIFWLKADDKDSLINGFLQIAHLLELVKSSVQGESKTQVIIDLVKNWLTTRSSWLIVLDNLEDLTLITELLPTNNKGNIIITTPLAVLGTLANKIVLPKLSPTDALNLLLKRSFILKDKNPLTSLPPEELSTANEIIKEMDSLPLALDQAGAFIEQCSSNLQEYLQLYREQAIALLDKTVNLPQEHASVLVTFTMAFKKVTNNNQILKDLIKVCSFLAPDDIPEEIFMLGGFELGEELAKLQNNKLLLLETLAKITKYSLLQRNSSNNTVSIHRLVQKVIKDYIIESSEKSFWLEKIIKALNKTLPVYDQSNCHSNWLFCQKLVTHCKVIAEMIQDYNLNSSEAVSLLDTTGMFCQSNNQYLNSEYFFSKLLRIYLKVCGSTDVTVANCLHNLASSYIGQDKHAEAEKTYTKSLKITQAIFGKDHPNFANSLNSLAGVYTDKGMYDEAEKTYLESLKIKQIFFDEDHLSIANSFNNLGKLYLVQARYSEAEPLLNSALEIYKKVSPTNYSDIAICLHNLASLYRDMAKYDQAEKTYLESLKITESLSGQYSSAYANILNNLADTYDIQGKYDHAEKSYKTALEIRESIFHENHSAVANSLNGLATFYLNQAKYNMAEPLYIRGLKIIESIFGRLHPHTSDFLNNLAATYDEQNKDDKAENFYIRALDISKLLNGENHPSVAISLGNLGTLYQKQHKYDMAEPLLSKALEITRRIFGDNHPDYANCCNNLAALYRSQGKYKKAEPLLIRSLEIAEANFENNHFSVIHYLSNLALFYAEQKQHDKAEPLYSKLSKVIETDSYKKHPRIASSLNNLAMLYKSQKKYDKAESLFNKALEIGILCFGNTHPEVANSLNNLGSLYASQNKYDKAETTFLKALEMRESLLDPFHPDIATTLNNLANLYSSRNQCTKAEPLFVRAKEIIEKSLGSTHPNLAIILENYSHFLKKTNRTTEAANLLKRAKEIRAINQ